MVSVGKMHTYLTQTLRMGWTVLLSLHVSILSAIKNCLRERDLSDEFYLLSHTCSLDLRTW